MCPAVVCSVLAEFLSFITDTGEHGSFLGAGGAMGGGGGGVGGVVGCPQCRGAGELAGRELQTLVTVEVTVVTVLVLGSEVKSCFLTDEGVGLLVRQAAD